MKKVAIVILNWNGRKLLEEFLPSVCRYVPGYAEVVVADNGSTDDSTDFLRQRFPSVRLILLDRNYGFAEGYNRALSQLENEYAVLLNSDVEVTSGWLDGMTAYADAHPDVAACQPVIRSYRNRDCFEHAGAAGGFLDKYGFPFCQGRIFDTVEKDRGQYDRVTDVFWASGACLFIRTADYFGAGGLDAAFFAHMEEIDLCWRIHLQGKRIVLIPESRVFHLGGASLAAGNPRKSYLNFRNNLLMLHKNLPVKEGRSLLFKRRLLDSAAMFRFFLRGEFAQVRAVWNAHCDFRRMRGDYRNQPDKNILPLFPGGTKSIITAYYARGKRYFTDIVR